MPRPGPVHEKLAVLVGDWRGEEQMHPSPFAPEGAVYQGRTVNTPTAGGFAFAVEYSQEQNGSPTFSGHGVFHVDSENGDVLYHWWDATGMGFDLFRGGFEGDTLTVTCKNVMGHWRSIQTANGDTLDTKMEFSQDGENWQPFFEAKYQRQGS